METSLLRKQVIQFVILVGTILAILTVVPFLNDYAVQYIGRLFTSTDAQTGEAVLSQTGETALSLYSILYRVFKIILWMILVGAVIRFLNSLVFRTVLGTTSYEISTLLRNVISIVIFVVAFIIILQAQFTTAYEKLAPIFTGSTIIGIVIGLALQDTLGNFFAGAAIQADNPFQIGDVINIPGKGTGVVEAVSWRGVKIRTFQNKLIIISNSVLGKEAIEVAPRDNLNARAVFFNTIYTDSPAKTIQVIREAVRQVENVSQKIRPIVRVRDLAESGIDWEIKYWLEDYAKYNETDALIRQRIWYVFLREKINFAYPTRTLYIEKEAPEEVAVETINSVYERLNNVPIFAPLSDDETKILGDAAQVRIFAPGEAIVNEGERGGSMYIIHRGAVEIRIKEDDAHITLSTLREGDFFGEMSLFTGEPRSATVVARDETEVLKIKKETLRPVFENNPNLVKTLSEIIEERRKLIVHKEKQKDQKTLRQNKNVFKSIKKFFGLD